MNLQPIKRARQFSEQVRKIVQILKYSQKEQRAFLIAALAFLCALLVSKDILLSIPLAENKEYLTWALYLIGGAAFGYGTIQIWKKVIPPPEIESVAKPSAIKGPLSFGLQDGELFTQLGRAFELQQVADFVLNDQIPFIVVLGESGAGKSSLLRAGVEYASTSGKALESLPCIYWEALPTKPEESLLDTIQLKWQGDEKPAALKDLASKRDWPRHLILIDQSEQLTPHDHPGMFDFFQEVMTLAGGSPITLILAFREEYLVTWSKYLIARKLPIPKTVTVERFSTEQARRVMATLASDSELNLSEAVMRDLLDTISQENGRVSPVDIGISLLVLSELGRGKQTVVTEDIYRQAGKAEGLLASYIENHLKRLPEHAHEPILKAMIGLFDIETNQRVAEGKSIAELSGVAGLPAADLEAYLKYLASSQVRILQTRIETKEDRTPGLLYRLAHERIIPALRRLTGRILVDAEQARMLLERRFKVWKSDRQRRDLLTRREYKSITHYVGQFAWGEDREQKQRYVSASKKRLRFRNFAFALTLIVSAVLGGWGWRLQEEASYRTMLEKIGLPPLIYDQAHQLDTLVISGPSLRYGKWKDTSLDSLSVQIGAGSSNEVVLPDAATGLDLSLSGSLLTNFEGIIFPGGAKSLQISGSGYIASLEGLSLPSSVTTLTLSLRSNQVQSLEGLSLPSSVTTLTLDLSWNQVQSLEGLSLPSSVTTLTLDLGGNRVEDYERFVLPSALKAFTLNVGFMAHHESLEGLKFPEGLVTLNISGSNLSRLQALPLSVKDLRLYGR